MSELEVHRYRRGAPMLTTDAEVVDLVRRLVEDGLDDTQVARVLIRQGRHTTTGLSFTKRRVQSVRQQYHIVRRVMAQSPGEKMYTAEEAARELEVSSQTVHHWLRAGLLRGKQAAEGAPWCIPLDEQTRHRLAGSDAPEGWVGLEEAARQTGRLQAKRRKLGQRRPAQGGTGCSGSPQGMENLRRFDGFGEAVQPQLQQRINRRAHVKASDGKLNLPGRARCGA